MIGNLKPLEILLIVAVIFLLFGAKKLPDAARSLGKSMRIFKSEIKEMQSESKSDSTDGVVPPAKPIASERVEPSTGQSTPEQSSDKRPA